MASSEADLLLRDGRQEQEQLLARNKLLQSESLQCSDTIRELNHTIARRRQELQVYEVKLKDWNRREEIALDVRGDILLIACNAFGIFCNFCTQLERSLMQREAVVAANERSLQVFVFLASFCEPASHDFGLRRFAWHR
jgi:hypothetical protein